MREYVCARCGKIVASTCYRRFCSKECSEAYRKNLYGWGTNSGEPCLYNQGVNCGIHQCESCGWNPEVEARRKEAFAIG